MNHILFGGFKFLKQVYNNLSMFLCLSLSDLLWKMLDNHMNMNKSGKVPSNQTHNAMDVNGNSSDDSFNMRYDTGSGNSFSNGSLFDQFFGNFSYPLSSFGFYNLSFDLL